MDRKRYSWENARAIRVESNLNYQSWVLRCVYLCTNERIRRGMMAVSVDDERVSTKTAGWSHASDLLLAHCFWHLNRSWPSNTELGLRTCTSSSTRSKGTLQDALGPFLLSAPTYPSNTSPTLHLQQAITEGDYRAGKQEGQGSDRRPTFSPH